MIDKYRVRTYCCEDISNIENYEIAIKSPNKWVCHHRLEIKDNGVRVGYKELIKMGLYYKRPAKELIFLSSIEHGRLHNIGKVISEESRFKMSVSRKGKKKSILMRQRLSASTKGKPRYWLRGRALSEETKQKISESHKGIRLGVKLSKETIDKQIAYRTGCHWYNNGVLECFCKECPEGFILGRLKKTLVK